MGPSENVKVNGVNFTPLFYKHPQNCTVNGLNIEGIGIAFFLFMIPEDPANRVDNFTNKYHMNINGLTIAPAGIFQGGELRGVSITPLYSYITKVKGLNMAIYFCFADSLKGMSISMMNSSRYLKGVQLGLINTAYTARGIQIGLINRSKTTKGLQIGLWNVNEARRLPIVNWN
jgi:hypothetical protein